MPSLEKCLTFQTVPVSAVKGMSA